jgi:hypothetical protein
LQLTLDHVVKRHWDHVRLMYNLSNSTTLAQKIAVGSVFSVTEILTIKYHKLNITFLHVAFGSQSLLKPISDQTTSDTDWSTGEGDQGGGGWMGAN